jgi:translation initiation factor IF-2
MKDHHGQNVGQAVPSMPVKILGLKESPEVGDIIEGYEQVTGLTKKRKGQRPFGRTPLMSSQKINESEESGAVKINILLKADVLGSLEAIEESLTKIEHQEVKVKIINKGLGNITEADILQAEAGQALVVGFSVLLPHQVESLANDKKVTVKLYKVIYDLINDIKKMMEEQLRPEIRRVELGRLAVISVFRKEANSMIVGGRVNKGKLEPDCLVNVFRVDQLIAQGRLLQLQLGKQNVSEVKSGQECGVKYQGKPVLAEGDILEAYKEEKVMKKLEE